MADRMPFIVFAALSGMLSAAPAQAEAVEEGRGPDPPEGVEAVPMEVFADRIFIPVKLNGTEVKRCLIDTGSEVTLVNQAHVDLQGFRSLGGDRLQGSFVGGIAARRIEVPSFEIGAQVFNNLRASLINHGKGQELALVEMLLGMDFLSRYRFSLDFSNRRFLLWLRHQPLPAADKDVRRIRLPLHQRLEEGGRRPWVWGTFGAKHPVCFLLDTGADGPLVPLLTDPGKCGVVLGAALGHHSAGSGRRVTKYAATFERLGFGDVEFINVPGRVIDAAEVRDPLVRRDLSDHYTVLGTTFLKTLQAVHIDLPEEAAWFDVKPAEQGATPGPKGGSGAAGADPP